MPRKRRQKVDYFPHRVAHGETMAILEERYGNDGYAFWFKLLELLGRTEGHCFRAGKPIKLAYLASHTHLTVEIVTEILDLLAELEAIDPELWEAHIIWCENFVDGLTPLYDKRAGELPKKPDICTGYDSNDTISGDIRAGNDPTEDVSGESIPKGKDSIVSRVKDIKKESTIDSAEYLPQARHLSERIIENDAIYFKNKNIDATLLKWAGDIRKLATRDGRDIETIDKVIDWCQASDFWRANILSGAKLRDKFPTLLQQMNSNGHKKQEAKRPFKHDFEGLTPEQKVEYYGKGGKL